MRKRYVFDPELGEMVEIISDPPKRDSRTEALWGDRHYDGLRAPDGADISSRKKHRDYMKKMGYATADDFKDTWAKSTAERENYMKNGGSVRREDVMRAIHQLQGKR